MACTSCRGDSGVIYDNPSILGRNITGRSIPGHDVRQKPVNMTTYYSNGNLQQKKLINWDWGTFLIGVVVGGVVIGLLVTSTGRGLLGAAGERTTRYIRGR